MKKSRKAGFTLTETLVAVIIFALVGGVVITFIVLAYRVYGYSWQQSVAINEARKGIETMIRELILYMWFR